jgi:hypothetical protein
MVLDASLGSGATANVFRNGTRLDWGNPEGEPKVRANDP